MATTASQTKKSTTKRTASKGSSSGKTGGSRSGKTPPQPEKRPIRREVLGGIFLLLCGLAFAVQTKHFFDCLCGSGEVFFLQSRYHAGFIVVNLF